MLDMAESLKEVSDQNYKDMGFPIGLVIKIKKRLQSDDAQLAAGAQSQPEAASVAQTMVNTNKEENKIPDFNPLTVKDGVSSNTRQVAVEDSPQFQKMEDMVLRQQSSYEKQEREREAEAARQEEERLRI